jgi:hypothetical protein
MSWYNGVGLVLTDGDELQLQGLVIGTIRASRICI